MVTCRASARNGIIVGMRTRIGCLSLLAVGATAQVHLTLKDAVRQALGHHPALDAATARVQASEARIGQVRSARLPRVQYLESFQSGNNPVYVFGALLTQRQFTAANFALDPLNRPDALNNVQSQVVAKSFAAQRAGSYRALLNAVLQVVPYSVSTFGSIQKFGPTTVGL